MTHAHSKLRAGAGRARSRRAVMLPAVMLIVVLVALIGATLTASAGARAHGASASLSRRQARTLAWSGVQAAMAELADQRVAMLKGATPKLTSEWSLFESGGRRGVVRLVSLDAEGDVTPEAGRANVNTTPDEALRALVGPAAGAIIAARQGGAIAAVESIDLAPAKGESGGASGTSPASGPSAAASPPPALSSVSTSGGEDAPRGEPARVLTALSCDPDVQAGVGPGGDEHAGRDRINLAGGWSRELGEQITARFGAEGAQAVERVMNAGTKFGSASDIVAVLRQLAVPEGEWGVLLDAYSATQGAFVPGRVDINRASADVLAAVAGMTPESAEAIVGARSRLTEESRALVTWPLSEGLISVEQFQAAVDHITTRSLQWRVRIEAGVVVGGMDEKSVASVSFGAVGEAGRGGSNPGGGSVAGVDWAGRVVYEAVIDVAAERPRVAYLRDVTLDEIRHLLPGRATRGEPGLGEEGSGDGSVGAGAEAMSDGVPFSNGVVDADLDLEMGTADADLSLEGMDAEPMTSAIEASLGREPPPGAGEARAAPAPDRGDDRVGRWSTRGRSGGQGGKAP
ncbi:MAG: hypothetical protein JNL50_07170 [Phycisphaerae bacterium]|nr:hypothetical protein [Phycisphaerae bacterium]